MNEMLVTFSKILKNLFLLHPFKNLSVISLLVKG
jgi:hypothetical protein